MPDVLCVSLGRVEYGAARALQTRLREERAERRLPDLLLLLEHDPVYTRGRRSGPEELPMGVDWYRMQGIDVQDTDRGGRVTYHGPGQLVGYPIVSLHEYGFGVREYVARMERVICESLGELGVTARTYEGLTGVWTPDPERRKIGSIGIHVAQGITTHGFAVNVSNDLQPFEWIVPCGLEGARFTSLSRELGREVAVAEYAEAAAQAFGRSYGREIRWVEASEIGALAEAGTG